MTDYESHVNEAIEALGQYLRCVATNKMVGRGEECLRDLQDQTRQAMISATPCPVCESLGCTNQHGRNRP